ncbi:MAG: beta-ketoacyl synthase N-terminal-like domain-containing protein [Candidatus Binatia bacterium]
MIPVHIAGVGMSQFGKSSNTLVEIMEGAAARALAGSKIQDIEAVYIAVMNPEEFTGDANLASHVVEALGLTGIPALRVETASSAGAAALHTAFHSVASGYYRQVLVIGGEKMTHLSTSATTRILAEVIDAQERQCGATMPALAAMITEKYRRQHHISASRMARALCAVAMKNHAYGAHNPYAQFRQILSKEKYLASKFVATPLRLYDCAPITDGAAAVILTAERSDLLVSGIGQGTGPVSLRERDSLITFPATQIAARRAYEMAGIGPREVDCAEVHDAFTSFEIIGTEDLGFFAPGKGGHAALSGQTAADGVLPVNLSGGLKSRGHPVGASGVAQIVEIARLLRGESAVKLKREPHRALAQSIGGLATNNFVTIVEQASDATGVQNLWQARPATDFFKAPAKKKAAAAIGAEGVIETFTVLHITPDGFLPPLALALIRDRKGALIMAQGEDIIHLKIGREVYLRQVAGAYYFTVKRQLQKVRQAIRQLLSKKRSPAGRPAGAEKKVANG